MEPSSEQLFQLAVILARFPPKERIAFARSNGIPLAGVRQLEGAAEQIGLTLNGGPIGGGDDEDEDEDGEGADGEEEEQEDGEDDGSDGGAGASRPYDPRRDGVVLSDVLALAKEKWWALLGPVAFFLGVPAVLYIIKERRAMSWRDMWTAAARLPFSD